MQTIEDVDVDFVPAIMLTCSLNRERSRQDTVSHTRSMTHNINGLIDDVRLLEAIRKSVVVMVGTSTRRLSDPARSLYSIMGDLLRS